MPRRATRVFQVAALVVLTIIVGVLFLTLREETGSPLQRNASSADHFDQAICSQNDIDRAAPISCTIITASQGEVVLFANNEDWISPDTYYWVRPGSNNTYGAIYFGFDDFYPQGGINDRGLAYDINGLPAMALNPHRELPGAPIKAFAYMLERAATVDEAIELLSGFSWGDSFGGQVHIADATGAAAVMSAGADGELAFTRKEQGDGYLVSTNFNLAYPQNGDLYCWRYNMATRMLDEIFERSVLDVEQLRMVLDAVHQEGPSVNTVYSNIFDLRQGVIYLYHWYQFDEVVVLDVDELLTQGFGWSARIQSLFSQATQDEAASAFDYFRSIPDRWRPVAQIYLGITAVSLVVMLWSLTRVSTMSWRMRLVWFLSGIFLGPIGLLVFLLSTHGTRGEDDTRGSTAPWRVALAGSVYSLVGYGGGWFLALAFMMVIVGDFAPRQLLGIMYALPLLIGLLLFRAPLIAVQRKTSYWDALRRSMLPEFIALNFAGAGFIPATFFPARLFFSENPGIGPPLLLFTLMMGFAAGFVALIPLNLWITYRAAAGEVRLLSSGAEPIGAAGDSLTLRKAWYLAIASVALYLGSVYVTFLKF